MIAVRPTHITSSVILAAVLATAGCGGTAKRDEARAHRKPEVRYDAPEVSGFFRAVTGDPLETEPSTSWDSLAPDRSDFRRSGRISGRYGTFLIFVLHRPGAEEMYKTRDGRPVKPDAEGVYWHDRGGSWSAMKPYRNVVLEWMTDERRVDERFARLDTVLSHLGEPTANVRAAMAPEDRPCADQGIDQTSGGEGTCRDANGATVTIVNRNHRLRLPGMDVRTLRVETGRVVVPPTDWGMVRHAKGRFVLAVLKLDNTGKEPIRDLSGVKLRIGEKTYDQDFAAGFTVTPVNAFPVQPGDRGAAGVVFDLPPTAADRAVREGVLAFPADEDLSTVESAARLGVIRLAKPAAAEKADGEKA